MEEKVSFVSEGLRLVGNLHIPCDNAPCVIALHGLEGDKDWGKWPRVASQLYRAGYACLRFNFRGCGEERSDGNFEDLTLSGRIEDYKAALQYVYSEERVDSERIGVIGSSLGGMVAIAGKQKVNAIVTMGSPYKIPRYGKPLIPRKEEGDYYILPSGNRIKEDFYEDIQNYDLTQDIKEAPPLMIIHGSNDEIVPMEHPRTLYESAIEPKDLQIVEGADHSFSNSSQLDRALELAREWFNKYL